MPDQFPLPLWHLIGGVEENVVTSYCTCTCVYSIVTVPYVFLPRHHRTAAESIPLLCSKTFRASAPPIFSSGSLNPSPTGTSTGMLGAITELLQLTLWPYKILIRQCSGFATNACHHGRAPSQACVLSPRCSRPVAITGGRTPHQIRYAHTPPNHHATARVEPPRPRAIHARPPAAHRAAPAALPRA